MVRSYGARGVLQSVVQGPRRVDLEVDGLGRVRNVRSPHGLAVTLGYDAADGPPLPDPGGGGGAGSSVGSSALLPPYWHFVDPRPDALRDASADPLGPRYHNAWEHALGGEYARSRNGALVAGCLNELKEFFWDRYRYGNATVENNRDWWNSQQGIWGRHRTATGAPDSTHLLADPEVEPPKRYR